jgi:hypothetical protein
MKMSAIDIIRQFNMQMKRNKSDLINYYNKQLFLLTKDLTPKDWRKIRDEDYWEKMDGFSNTIIRLKEAGHNTKETEAKKLKYQLQKIENYINQ